MALIKCPECEKEISDKAKSCPNCGCPISNNDFQANEPEISVKIENNSTFANDEIEFSENFKRENKRKIAIIIIAIICLIAMVVTISIAIISNNRKKEREREIAEQTRITYIDNLNKLKNSALSGAAEVEGVGGTIHDIWYNCINKVYNSKTNKYTINETTNMFYTDFNDALEKYMYSDFIFDIAKVNVYYSEIKDYYTALQNPTDEFKKCYESMEEMYDVYLEFYSIVKNPSGSLVTYTQNFNEKDTEFMNAYNKYKELVPLQVSE